MLISYDRSDMLCLAASLPLAYSQGLFLFYTKFSL